MVATGKSSFSSPPNPPSAGGSLLSSLPGDYIQAQDQSGHGSRKQLFSFAFFSQRIAACGTYGSTFNNVVLNYQANPTLFTGGTGVNLTPPPSALVSEKAIKACRKRIELVANVLGLEGVARIDAFLHADTGEVIVIEGNTVPAMTPSTVLIHQALAEQPPMYPPMFFRRVVDLALSKQNVKVKR